MPFHYLHSHQTFSSVANMKYAVTEHLARRDLTKSERAILLRIAQSALKYPGVAHLKAATIATSTKARVLSRFMTGSRFAHEKKHTTNCHVPRF